MNNEKKYLLKTKYYEKEVNLTDEIELIVRLEYRGYLRNGKYKYKGQNIDISYIYYFDIDEFKMKYKQSRDINQITTLIDTKINNKIYKDYVFKKNIKTILEDIKFYKKYLRIYPSIINYEEQTILVSPYYLGIWLGDGDSAYPNRITNIDIEVINYLYEFAESIDMKISHNLKYYYYYLINKNNRRNNKLKDIFSKLNLIKNKHIPEIYLKNSYDIRIQVLAGLIDTDGTNGNSTNSRSCYSFTQKDEKLFDQVRELVFSLGLLMSKEIYTSSKIIKGEKRIYSAFAGIISGEDEIINSIPIKIIHKKVNHIKKFNKQYLKYEIIEM